MKKKKNPPCGMSRCSITFVVDGEEKKDEYFCHFDNADPKVKRMNETIFLEPVKCLWVNGRSIADLRVVRSCTDELLVRLIGHAKIPGKQLRLEARDYQNGKIVEIVSDGPLCCGMADDLTVVLSIPKGYVFDSLIFTGKSIASDIPLTATYSAALSALNDIRFDIRSLTIKVKTTDGNIEGAITGVGSSHADIYADNGNINIRLDGYDTCNTLISASSSEILFTPSSVVNAVPTQLIGSIRANTGTVVIR